VNGFDEIASTLLEAGADHEYRVGKLEHTVLHLAARNGRYNLVSILLNHGANPDAANALGYTPRDIAEHFNLQSIVQMMKDAGSQYLSRQVGDYDIFGLLSVFGEAVEKEKVEVVRSMIELEFLSTKEVRQGLGFLPRYAVLGGNVEILNLLFQAGFSIEAPWESRFENPVWEKALTWGPFFDDEVAAAIFSFNPEYDRQDGKGDTALHRLVRSRSKEAVELLLKHGADFEIKNENGETPIFGACEYPGPEVLKLLLRAGANHLVKNSKGETPLDVAMKHDEITLWRDEVIEILRADFFHPLNPNVD
jgi:ankyrin repeat protein